MAIEDFLRLTGGAGAPVSTTVFVVLDVVIGAITFTGSLVAGASSWG